MLRHVFRFYLSFAPATIMVTLACVFIYRLWGGETLMVLALFKLLTNALISFITTATSDKRFYYYYNLHLSKTKLWSLSLGFDLALLILLVVLTQPLSIPA